MFNLCTFDFKRAFDTVLFCNCLKKKVLPLRKILASTNSYITHPPPNKNDDPLTEQGKLPWLGCLQLCNLESCYGDDALPATKVS